ncbi:ran GTPase-activating protein 1-like [Dendronephthya gigantea]|uniref:ran GTPase-activating protein 1-like n=1 Tax=Dendronephthya gigantea TaxID=151771 RepID=UPI00106B0ECA|nr:ran GTPase-activating protein 1-like [Dendronephthya gigantea]
MALGNEVDDVTGLLEKTSVKQINIVRLPDKGRKLNTAEDVIEVIKAIEESKDVQAFTLEGHTLGIEAAKAIGSALSKRQEFQRALWNDMFTGRLRSEIPIALESLGDGVIAAGAHLTELDLCDNAFGPDGVRSVKKLLTSPSCFSLEVLKFNNNGLGIGGGQILSDALLECHKASVDNHRPLKLKVFVAGRNRLENEGATALAKAFKVIGSLEEISMPQNGINHAGVAALAGSFKSNQGLKVVNLNDNTFTSKAAIAMSKILPSLPDLEVINFGDCLVKSKGAIAIAEALENSVPKLKELVLAFGEINKEAAMRVVESMENKLHLEKLDLNGNCLGEDGIEEIKWKLNELKHENVLASMSDDEGEEDEEDEEDEREDEEDEEDDDESEDDSDEVEKSGDVEEGTLRMVIRLSAFDVIMRERFIARDNHLKTAKEFLGHPSLENFKKLPEFDRIELIKEALQTKIADTSVICKLFVQASCVLHNSDDFIPCTDVILQEAFLKSGKPETVINSLLIHMGLLKSEDKLEPASNDITGALQALNQAARQEYFPKDLAFFFTAFLSKPNCTVKFSESARTNLLQTLEHL